MQSLRFNAAGGVTTLILDRGNDQIPARNRNVRRIARVSLKFIISPSATAEIERPIIQIERSAVELVTPNKSPSRTRRPIGSFRCQRETGNEYN